MTSALYGRMKPGRCISGDYHHTVGCFTDVLTYMDSKCSGRRDCMVIVGSLELVAQPCQKDFKSYLEASYKCVPVMQAQPELCQSVESIYTPPNDVAFGRSTLESAGDAATTCSWELSANAGQQVTLVLSSFPKPIVLRSPGAHSDSHPSVPAPPSQLAAHEACPWEVVIHEGDNVKKVELCSHDDREREIYTSSGSNLHISFAGTGNIKNIPYFLLRHKGKHPIHM